MPGEGIDVAIDMNMQLRAPMLKPCANCGGTGDYLEGATSGKVVARCLSCGMGTGEYSWASGAGEAWNRRASEGARVVTLAQLREAAFDGEDDLGAVAVWVETRRGELRAAVLALGIDFGDTTVTEYGMRPPDDWPQARIAREGLDWRLWDRKPTREERDARGWNGRAWEEARVLRGRRRIEERLGRGE